MGENSYYYSCSCTELNKVNFSFDEAIKNSIYIYMKQTVGILGINAVYIYLHIFRAAIFTNKHYWNIL
jgi:hypothetical protein